MAKKPEHRLQSENFYCFKVTVDDIHVASLKKAEEKCMAHVVAGFWGATCPIKGACKI